MPNLKGHSSVRFLAADENDYDALTGVWEASVRATHDFVSPSDIDMYRKSVREEALPHTDVVYLRDDTGAISGFVGVVGDKIEMLFVSPAYRGHGIGKRLFWHAVCELHATKLDVNEQNVDAVNFYMRQGCKVTGRSPLDGMGRPYPLLHLEWAQSN